MQNYVGSFRYMSVIDNIGKSIWKQIRIRASIIWPDIYFKTIRRGEKKILQEWA